MTPLEIRVGICILSIQVCALSIILRLALAQLKALRRDVIAAGIDIHQALVEANIYHRLAAMGSSANTASARTPHNEAGQAPHPSPPSAETDLEWLERKRRQRRV